MSREYHNKKTKKIAQPNKPLIVEPKSYFVKK